MTPVPTDTSSREATRTTARPPRELRRARWHRARASVAGALGRGWSRTRQIVTPAGGFVALAVIVTATLGAVLGWVEAIAISIAGALLLLAAIPFLLGGRGLEIQLGADQARVVAGGSVQLTVTVTNTGARPTLPVTAELPVGPALRELTVPTLAAADRVVLREEVPTPYRGVLSVGPLTLARRDPVGLLRRDVSWPDAHRVHVHPVTVPLPPAAAGLVRDLEGEASRRLTDSDLSFHAVREYAAGDPRRHIHWRSTAKTGRLMVRQYEESQTARSAILFDANPAEYDSAEAFELGVSVAASLSLQAVREGRERTVASQWVPGLDRSNLNGVTELPARTPTQLLDAWARVVPAEGAAPVEDLSGALAESGRTLSLVVIVTGSVPDAARLRRTAARFSPDVAVLLVRCEPLADPAAHRGDAGTVVTVGALGDLPQLLIRRGTA